MAYQIQYGKASPQERIAIMRYSKKTMRLKWVVAVVAIFATTLLARFGLLDFLIPGDREVTRNAFNTMVDDVQNGESVRTALTAFCEEILVNSGYAG